MTPEQERRAIAMLDGLIPVPRLTRTRVNVIWRTKRPMLTWCVDRFPEGTIYRVWIGWLLVKVRVPAHGSRISR